MNFNNLTTVVFMTVIIGYTNKSGSYIASDSYCTAGYDIISKNCNKIEIFNNSVGIASSGKARMQTIIANELNIEHNKHDNDDKYIYSVCNQIRDLCIKYSDSDNDEDVFNIIVVYNKKIYQIDKIYALSLIQEPFYAEGSGGAYAMGAMYAIETRCDFKNRNTEEYANYIINAGLDAAIEYSAGCGGDKKIVKIG